MDRTCNSFPVLSCSPIVEATCQVNLAFDKPLTRELAVKLAEQYFSMFKLNGDIFSESISVKKKKPDQPPEQITHQQNWNGVRFVKENRVVTFFQDGFAYGIVSPYPNDGSFFGEVCSVMEKLVGTRTPECAVTRIGLRFINRLPVGENGCERLKDVLATLPDVPMSQEPERFLYQDCFFDRKTEISTVVNRVYPANDSDAPSKPMIILDIDSSLVPQKCLALSEFGVCLSSLRYSVNKVFFDSVGPKMMEAFK